MDPHGSHMATRDICQAGSLEGGPRRAAGGASEADESTRQRRVVGDAGTPAAWAGACGSHRGLDCAPGGTREAALNAEEGSAPVCLAWHSDSF